MYLKYPARFLVQLFMFILFVMTHTVLFPVHFLACGVVCWKTFLSTICLWQCKTLQNVARTRRLWGRTGNHFCNQIIMRPTIRKSKYTETASVYQLAICFCWDSGWARPRHRRMLSVSTRFHSIATCRDPPRTSPTHQPPNCVHTCMKHR